ncbi:AMP-binding protein [Piscinibacter koreensis]|uniref:acetate--CoA ligase n=1 Tax=Piscinibacter koreensis TaxID=2742824 RepID=A0A7Y6NQK7_9BURK|nr:AMP-binding protein [Schlegelella koreensis]NUZ07510.1 AMP-binding protein [Schlegelella koreensis]
MDSTKRPFEWLPLAATIAGSNLTAFIRHTGQPDLPSLQRRADADPAWLMEQVLGFCDFRFYKPYERMLDTSRGIEWARWCVGGTTNIVLNCIDRHRGTPAWDRTFITWEGEDPKAPNARRELSYREFDAELCRLAGALEALGVQRGDRVGLYMPNLPETFIAFFAVLKIGAVIMPLFSGFGPQPLVARLNDGEAKVVLTVDGTWRRGSPGAMKSVLDEALASTPSVEHVLVLRNLGDAVPCPMTAGRDLDWATAVAGQAAERPTAEMAADDAAVLLYTSGTTGKPKGCVWTHVGFLGSMVTRDMHICGDFRADDRFFFMSDMGWMVGAMCACIPSYFGGSLLVAEGTPDYPDTGRFWRLLQDHRVTYLGVAPTLIRGLMRHGDQDVERYDLSALRITVSGGEAWTEAPWRWFFEHVCKKKLPFLNIVGGTEVGGCNFTGTVHHPLRPGSFGMGGLGVGVDIVDEAGQPVGPGQVGELVLRNPNIGFTKSLWRDDERYLDSYWRTIPGLWVHGDFAMRDADGLVYILGRSDDTIKVSGKRTGPSEIETLLTGTGKVSEAAVIGVPDEVKGSAIVCVCVPMPGVAADGTLEQELAAAVVKGMGSSYRPRQVLLVSDLPKTRNMKIMRRVVRAVYRGDSPGDLSSLVNPEAVADLRARLSA